LRKHHHVDLTCGHYKALINRLRTPLACNLKKINDYNCWCRKKPRHRRRKGYNFLSVRTVQKALLTFYESILVDFPLKVLQFVETLLKSRKFAFLLGKG
jgi:hypothetical protein